VSNNIMQQQLRIVMLLGGWIVVGTVADGDNHLTIGNASTIRECGTTKSLGGLVLRLRELAQIGPTDDTILDPCGDVIAHKGSVLLYIDCVQSNWTGNLP